MEAGTPERKPAPPSPTLEGPAAMFYEHIRKGELWLQYRAADDRWVFPPREMIEQSASPLEWRKASGRGSVYSWTVIERVMHPAFDRPPYVIALVKLAEGPILMTRLTNAIPASVTFDLPVIFDGMASKTEPVPFPLFLLS